MHRLSKNTYAKDFLIAVVIAGLGAWTFYIWRTNSTGIEIFGLSQSSNLNEDVKVSASIQTDKQLDSSDLGEKETGKFTITNGTANTIKIYGIGHRCSCVVFKDLPIEIESGKVKSIGFVAPVNYFSTGNKQDVTLYCSGYGNVPVSVEVR